ncbi:hypothetical protein Tco_0537252 [Tanacetum coccineum]
MCDDDEEGRDPLEFIPWRNSKFKDHKKVDETTKRALLYTWIEIGNEEGLLKDKVSSDEEMGGTLLDPFQFSYPKRKLTMEEIVNKFIEEGKREHEEMEAFIREFRTTNELLLKERNNSLRELEFEIRGLLRVINKAQMVGCEAKGVTTRGGKSTTESTGDNNNTGKYPLPHLDEPTMPDKIPTKTEPIKNQERTIKLQPSSIPFPHRLRKEKEEAQQRKFLENLK